MLASAEAAHASTLLRSVGSTRPDKPPRHATKVRPWVQPATFEKAPRAFSAQTFGTHSVLKHKKKERPLDYTPMRALWPRPAASRLAPPPKYSNIGTNCTQTSTQSVPQRHCRYQSVSHRSFISGATHCLRHAAVQGYAGVRSHGSGLAALAKQGSTTDSALPS